MNNQFQNQILDMACQIKPDDKFHELKLTSWPYSRNLVKTICSATGLKFSYSRENIKTDSFKIKVNDNSIRIIKDCVNLIKKETINLKGDSHLRNKITQEAIGYIIWNQDKIKNKIHKIS